MLLHSFHVKLGEEKVYSEDRETNFFASAPSMSLALDEESRIYRDDFVYALTSKFRTNEWDVSARSPFNHREDILNFRALNGICRFDNPRTSEFFAVVYNASIGEIELHGRLSSENCKKLDEAFKEYKHGLETNQWLDAIDMSPQRRYGNLAMFTKLFEKEGLVVSFEKGFNQSLLHNRDSMLLTVKGRPELAFRIRLEIKGNFNRVKKSRAMLLRDIRELAENMNPQKDVSMYVNRMGGGLGAEYFPYDSPVMQDAIKRGAVLKESVLRAIGRVKDTKKEQSVEKPQDKEKGLER